MSTETTPTRYGFRATAGGWYEILDGEAVVDKIQGKDAAEARVAELAAAESAADGSGDTPAASGSDGGTGDASASDTAAAEASSADELVEYEMKRRGGTRGRVTDVAYVWDEGDVVPAPDGEFAHLKPGDYLTRPIGPSR